MAAKNPRLTTVVEPPLFDKIQRRAGKEGVSISAAVRDLLREACEIDEDMHWARVGEERLAGFRRAAARSHEAFWKGRA